MLLKYIWLHCLATGCAICRSTVDTLRKTRKNHYESALLSVLTNTRRRKDVKTHFVRIFSEFFFSHMTLCLPLFNKAITPSVLEKKLIISIVFRSFCDWFRFSTKKTTMSGSAFNIDGGYLEGLCRGFKCGILKQSDYLNLVQCETLEGLYESIFFVFSFIINNYLSLCFRFICWTNAT